jgi:hypothetical protein
MKLVGLMTFHNWQDVFVRQVERGTTATYLSSNGGNTAALVRLRTIRNDTDKYASALDTWPPDGLVVNGTHLPTKQV